MQAGHVVVKHDDIGCEAHEDRDQYVYVWILNICHSLSKPQFLHRQSTVHHPGLLRQSRLMHTNNSCCHYNTRLVDKISWIRKVNTVDSNVNRHLLNSGRVPGAAVGRSWRHGREQNARARAHTRTHAHTHTHTHTALTTPPAPLHDPASSPPLSFLSLPERGGGGDYLHIHEPISQSTA